MRTKTVSIVYFHYSNNDCCACFCSVFGSGGFFLGGVIITYSYDATGKYIQSSDAILTNINEQYIPIGYGTIFPSPTVIPQYLPLRTCSHLPEFVIVIIALAIILSTSIVALMR